MSKSYSEQICELCEIKTKYLITYTYFGEDKVVCEEIEEAKQQAEMLKGTIQELYPNFESNDNGNFMELFNLKYDNEDENATIAGYIYSRYKNIVNTHWFLGFLLFELEHGKNADVEKIKKVIKETEWKI